MPSSPVVPPITLSSTFAFDSNAQLSRAIQEHTPHVYSRLDNPTVQAVEAEIAALEGAERSLLVGSGVAAVHLALVAALGAGPGPLVVQHEVYGGTHELVEAVRWPVPVRRVALDRLIEVGGDLEPGAVLYLETPTNPLVRLIDIAAVRAACGPGVTIIVDGTFASPTLRQPLREGADLVLHSVTKAMGGHHDVVAGVVSGDGALMQEAWRWRKILGPTLDPAAAYRVWRGLQTLSLRVERHSATAHELARRLEAHAAVVAVHTPALPSHPDHALLQTVHRGGLAGGVLSFELATASAAARVVDRLRHIAVAASLGGVHTLIAWPAGVTHANVSDEDQRAAGVRPGLLRLAVGLEDIDGIWADLAQALDP
jgi:cystathionine beta-lyase/cystathionine gamma-synthase